VIVILVDEIMTNGYGMGSGISLFIATNICENIVWKAFSPTTINTGRGVEFEGAVVALFYLLITRGNKFKALSHALTREGLPNITNLLATIAVFAIVIFFQGFRVNIPLKSHRTRGIVGSHPIKLFYTSNMPIILQTAVTTNLFGISQALYARFPENFLVQLFGVWSKPGEVTSGLVYYISTPHSFGEALSDPLHFLTYVVFVLVSCSVLSYFWSEMSGSSAEKVYQQFESQDLEIQNYHSPAEAKKFLERQITIAVLFGGLCIGVLSIFADLLGAIGSGTGILLAVTTIYQYQEMLTREKIDVMTLFS